MQQKLKSAFCTCNIWPCLFLKLLNGNTFYTEVRNNSRVSALTSPDLLCSQNHVLAALAAGEAEKCSEVLDPLQTDPVQSTVSNTPWLHSNSLCLCPHVATPECCGQLCPPSFLLMRSFHMGARPLSLLFVILRPTSFSAWGFVTAQTPVVTRVLVITSRTREEIPKISLRWRWCVFIMSRKSQWKEAEVNKHYSS